jgi:hypothetical protein
VVGLAVTKARHPSPDEVVASYVEERLERFGFTREQAALLVEAGADWHRAVAMLLQGCPPSLVVQILS